MARLAKVLGDPATAVPIGETYLAGRPEARQPGRLASELLSEMDGPARLATDEELRAEVGRRVRSDFEAGRTVRVGGWILSSTEARLAALAALSAAPAAAASPAGP